MFRKFAAAAALLLMISTGLGAAAQPVQAQEPLPVFHIAPESGYACGAFWTIGEPVLFMIEDADGFIIHQQTKNAVPASWDETGEAGEVCFDFDPELAQPGNTASFTEGTLSKEVFLVGLSFDGVDLDGTASGTGPPGGTGSLCLDWGSICQSVTISTTGEWFVPFEGYDPDTTDLSEAHFKVSDEDWDEIVAYLPQIEPPPLPVLNANITNDELWVFDLGPDAKTIMLEVYAPETTSPKCWGEFSYLPGEDDPWLDCRDVGIDPGDHVFLLIDGEIIRDHLVIDLTLEVIDFENGIFSGAAPSGAYGWMYVCNPDDECFGLDLEINPDETWIVNAGPNSVDPEAWFNVNVAEEDGDWTTLETIQPPEPPNMEVGINWVNVYGFSPDDGLARIEVSREGADNPICSGEMTLNGAYDMWLECWDQCGEILPNDLVELYVDEILIKEHEVRYLTFETVDFGEGVFGGSADPETNVEVVLCGEDDCISSSGDTGEGTSWIVYFDDIPFFVEWFAAFVYDEDGDATQAEFSEPQEEWNQLIVNTYWVAVSGYIEGPHTVEIVVSREGEIDPIFEGDVPIYGEYDFWLDSWNEIQPGDLVEFYIDDVLIKSYVMRYLTFDQADFEARTFGGSADPETSVVVELCSEDWDCISGTADTGEGTAWEITFDVIPFYVDWFAALIYDGEGGATQADFDIPPTPAFTVHPYPGGVFGWAWPLDVEITLTIIDQDENLIRQESQSSQPAEWMPGYAWVFFDLEEIADQLVPGVIVSLDDGTTTKETTIVPLSFDGIDLDGNAYGIGPADGNGQVCLDQESECIEITVPASGEWTVYFDWYDPDMELYDAHVVIWDEDGDEIMANLPVDEPEPEPMFGYNPGQQIINAVNWPLYSTLNLEVDDPGTAAPVDCSDSGEVTGFAPWNPGDTLLTFDTSGCDIQPGFEIRITDGVLEKTTIVTPLAVDEIDYDQQIVYGSTGPEAYLDAIGVGPSSEFYPVTSDQDGNWEVAYSQDLFSFDYLFFIEPDQDGDTTELLVFPEILPTPYIRLNKTTGSIRALGWPLNSDLILEIDDPDTPGVVDYTLEGTVTEYAPWEEGLTMWQVDGGELGILPGFLIRISDAENEFVKELTVTSLSIDAVDYQSDFAAGSTGPGSTVEILVIGPESDFLVVESGSDGIWTAYFSIDLIGEETLLIMEWDEDGDSTEVRWFPNTPPIAEPDAYDTPEDLLLTVPAPGVLGNDSDPEGADLSAVLVSDVEHGVLILNPDGSFSYTPEENYFGVDSFSYYASDGVFESAEAGVSLTLNPVNDTPLVDAGPDVFLDEGQAFTGIGSFSDPDQDTWTGSVDYGEGPQDLILNPDQTFALEHVYPPDDGVFALTVTITDGSDQGSDDLIVTVNNVPPSVEVISFADGKDTVLTSIGVDLVGAFTDPGADTHTAVVDWGDGSDLIDPASSPLTVSHVYQTAGTYSITLVVTDDDGGQGSANLTLEVIDAAEAAQSAIEDLEAILADPDLDPEIADSLADAIVELEGANDGESNGGAIDKIDGGQWNAALVKIAKAIQDLMGAEDADPTLDFSATKEILAYTAKSVALEVVKLAEVVASKPQDYTAIQQAYDLIAQGQALLGSGDFLGAVELFQDAIKGM